MILHSSMPPLAEGVRPVPVTSPPSVGEPGIRIHRDVGFAEAGPAKASTPTMPDAKSAAAASASRVSLPNRLMIPPGFPRPLSQIREGPPPRPVTASVSLALQTAVSQGARAPKTNGED